MAAKSDIASTGYGYGTFASLKIPAYRLYFGALLGQMAAMNMQMVARSWFMYELTGSATMLAAVGLASGVPMLTLSLFGGVMADRINKKSILIIGQFASGLVALGIAVYITLGAITWHHLFVASFLQATVASLMMPSRQAIIHELVGESSLMNAIALNAAAMNLLRLLAPAFAGFFIAIWSIEGVYYIMAALYATGLLFVIYLPATDVVQIRSEGTMHEVREGLRYIRNNTDILALLVLTLAVTILSMPYFFLLPIFTKDIFSVNMANLNWFISLPVIGSLFSTLGKSSARLGLLVSVSGIGAFIGSLIVATMPSKRRGLIYLLSLLLSGITLVLFSMTSSYLLALLIFIPLGFGQSGRMALSNTLLQSYTEDAYRGRVMSVYMMEWGITMVGVFFVGIMADYTGVQWAVGGTAGLMVAVTLYCLIFTTTIRKLD
jgi:MFS family permease